MTYKKDEKRLIREEKRAIKKDGNRSRRRHLQRELEINPETAHEATYEFTHDTSTVFNGMDKKKKRETHEDKPVTAKIIFTDVQVGEAVFEPMADYTKEQVADLVKSGRAWREMGPDGTGVYKVTVESKNPNTESVVIAKIIKYDDYVDGSHSIEVVDC